MQPPAGCAGEGLAAELAGDVGRRGRPWADAASESESCSQVGPLATTCGPRVRPFPARLADALPRPVWTRVAPGTAAATAFAALCCPAADIPTEVAASLPPWSRPAATVNTGAYAAIMSALRPATPGTGVAVEHVERDREPAVLRSPRQAGQSADWPMRRVERSRGSRRCRPARSRLRLPSG